MRRYLNEYNEKYNEDLTFQNDGLIILQEDANKWGLELRLYVYNRPSEKYINLDSLIMILIETIFHID